MQNIIQDIRRQCRFAMNGVASASMRQKGINYKINFGLVIQQIKTISQKYEQSKELAEALWKEDTRELKILATMLYPIDEFTSETADKWTNEIPNQEIREQVCLNLFQELPFAEKSATEWSNSNDEDIRITGYWLLTRLIIAKKLNKQLSIDKYIFIWNDIISANVFLRNATLLVLKHIGRQSKEIADSILAKISVYNGSEDLIKQEAYNNLAFEFKFYFG